MSSAVVLLSGGLDSLVSLGVAVKETDVKLALTFDYGQKAFEEEFQAASRIAKSYGIEHKCIKLDFLCELYSSKKDKDNTVFENVWVPNRNGLFINVAASFCDARGYDYIIFGANAREAESFPDNSKEFIEKINASLEFSTLNKAKVYAPLVDLTKVEIINLALKEDINLADLKSCYGAKGHCGKCTSCTLLKEAILESNNPDLSNLFFC